MHVSLAPVPPLLSFGHARFLRDRYQRSNKARLRLQPLDQAAPSHHSKCVSWGLSGGGLVLPSDLHCGPGRVGLATARELSIKIAWGRDSTAGCRLQVSPQGPSAALKGPSWTQVEARCEEWSLVNNGHLEREPVTSSGWHSFPWLSTQAEFMERLPCCACEGHRKLQLKRGAVCFPRYGRTA